MSKRFTDTNKWSDDWFGALDNNSRIIWLYLCDNCTIAGRWKKDFRGLNFNCNTQITEDEFKEIFGSRIVDRGTYFFIPKFINFQNPRGLSSKKPAVLSIVRELEKYDLLDLVLENESLNNNSQTRAKSLSNRSLTIIGKGKGTGKGRGIGKGKGIGTGKGEGESAREGEEPTETPEPELEIEPSPEKVPKTKTEIFTEIFTDDDFVGNLVRMYPLKNLQKAFDECFLHHSISPSPPRETWLWKQKLTTWLTGKEAYGQANNKRHERAKETNDYLSEYYRNKSPGK